MLANNTVPIGRILRVKDGLDMLCNVLLRVFLIHDEVNLLLELGFHLLVHLADDVVNNSICGHCDLFFDFFYYLNNNLNPAQSI